MDTPTFASKDQAAGWLAGMIDGEGTVGHYRHARGVKRGVRITSTDRELIDACSEACLLLSIAHTITGPTAPKNPKHSHHWTLAVRRAADLSRVADLPLRHHRKRALLTESLTTVRESRRPSRSTLEHLYVFEGKAASEIGRLLGVTEKPVLAWLRDEGIPIRSASDASALGHRNRGYEEPGDPGLCPVCDGPLPAKPPSQRRRHCSRSCANRARAVLA